jgi:serine/threonine-protein kinase
MIGERLSHYDVLGPLGAGGMGEVYRARDTNLGREVAIKVLPEELTEDPERLSRFDREAQMLASLNHPHIAQIHGLEEDNGRRFLVLELVDGETLAGRIARGPIPVDEALAIVLQVARALEAAHGRGLVHRDVKPGNIMITGDGDAKVLDFGIARPVDSDLSEEQIRTRTLAAPPTKPGILLGTPAYMSPEQLRGETADRRSDIWAFGVTLWEMLTGASLFGGETQSDTVAAVLQSNLDWRELPAATPSAIHRLLRRCIQPDPRQRLHAMADARLEIEEAIDRSEPVGTVEPVARPIRWWRPWPALLAAVAAGALIATGVSRLSGVRPAVSTSPVRVALALPEDVTIDAGHYPSVVISPDGSWLVFEARRGDTRQLFKRSLDRFEAVPISGTEDGFNPFFSPDGEWVGFFVDGKLMKVAISGGPPHLLTEALNPWGATWGPDDTIVFCPHESFGLWRVSAAGGEAELLVDPELDQGEWDLNWPEFLPDGSAVLHTGWRSITSTASVVGVLDLGTGKTRILLEDANFARYVPSGHLVFARDGLVHVVPFDADRREVTGAPVPLPEPVLYELENGVPHLAFSNGGTLAYVAGEGSPKRQLVSVDLEGRETPLFDARRGYMYPRYSPDGGRLAVTIVELGDSNVWVLDLNTGAQTKITFDGVNDFPVWSPDGGFVSYFSDLGQNTSIERKRADGTGESEQLVSAEHPGEWVAPRAWSLDGNTLVYWRRYRRLKTGDTPGIWLADLAGDRSLRPFSTAGSKAYGPALSADGRWLAYVSEESDRPEVYVQPFPDGGDRHQVSTDGGQKPVWSPDGRAIYYRTVEANTFMRVPVDTSRGFRAGAATVLLEGTYQEGPYYNQRDYDIAPDGSSFVMVKPDDEWGKATEIRMVFNWFDELERLVPGARPDTTTLR